MVQNDDTALFGVYKLVLNNAHKQSLWIYNELAQGISQMSPDLVLSGILEKKREEAWKEIVDLDGSSTTEC